MSHRKRQRQNKTLNPSELRICVPIESSFFGGAFDGKDDKGKWIEEKKNRARKQGQEHVKSLQSTSTPKTDSLKECSCGNGWILEGDLAVKHALKVHQTLYRQFLKLPGISDIDVGFLIAEQERKFLNQLALRLHLSNKRPIPIRGANGESDLTSLLYLLEPKDPSEQSPDESRSTSSSAKAKKDQRPFAGEREDLVEQAAKLHGTVPEAVEDAVKTGRYRRYPVSGVSRHDLSCCRAPEEDGKDRKSRKRSGKEKETSAKVPLPPRLSIHGVPLDIIGKAYFPAGRRSGFGREGVFAKPPQTSKELRHEELLFTGRNRVNTLVGGLSIGNETGTAGTLSSIVWDRTDGTPCMLGNWHVMAGDFSAGIGQPCYQPALFDGGTAEDAAGHLKRWVLGGEGDAALAELSGDRNFASSEVIGMWHPVSGTTPPSLNLEIRKWGRSSGYSKGFIDGIQMAVNLDYGGMVRHFTDQFHIAPLYDGDSVSQLGDSGALVLARYDLDQLESYKASFKKCLEAPNFFKEFRDRFQETDSLSEDLDLKKALGEFLRKTKVFIKEVADEDEGKPDEDAETLEKLRTKWLPMLLADQLREIGYDPESVQREAEKKENRKVRRVYFAVGMIFAGDTPGSPQGEFALASDIQKLEKRLHFSLRPIFEPRSSFRTFRTESLNKSSARPKPSGSNYAPGEPADAPNPGGPSGDPLRVQPPPNGNG